MQYTPKGIILEHVQKDIEQTRGIKDVHHVHVWGVTEEDIHFEAHINTVRNIKIRESCLIKNSVEKLLKERYSINHSTLQFEYDSCKRILLIKTIS